MYTQPPCTTARDFLIRNVVIIAERFALSALVLFVLASAALANEVKAGVNARHSGCAINGPDYDPAVDLGAFLKDEQDVANLLNQRKFKDLDCIADAARSNKTRLQGGSWELRSIYHALELPQGNATEVDWRNRLRLLQEWVTANPSSITARIALAGAYTNDAWFARGHGFSDTVSESGWKLFGERLEKAREILEKASTLSTKCPEWYAAMQNIALGEGWDVARENTLFEKAIAFEPQYDAYYREQATFLLPKWNGEEGDAAKVAQDGADRIGGADGNILYFQVAREIVCACDDPEFSHFSWTRAKKGFEDLEHKYGPTLRDLNAYALMAVKTDDLELADALFKQIGDKWDKGAWQEEGYFRSMREMAAQEGPIYARSRIIKETAVANMRSPEGTAYLKDFQPRFALFLKKCEQAAATDQGDFALFVQIAKDGSAENAWFTHPTNAAGCMLSELKRSHDLHETPFPTPPSPDYWLKFEMDPSTFKVATK